MTTIEEIWRDIKGYEGLYQISNLGNVKSLDRTVIRSDGVIQHREERIMSKRTSTDGYYIAKFNVNKISKSIAIHRLVAQAFIPNPDNLPEVNHINTDRKDNNVNNLEWCTHINNVRHSSDMGHYKRRYNEENGRARKIAIYNSDHKLLEEFKCMTDCAKYMIANNICRNDCSESYINNLRSVMGRVAKTGKPYFNHYFKYI